jgi:hypothetical protein
VPILQEHLQERVQAFPERRMAVNTITVTLQDGHGFSGVEAAWASEVIRVAA